MLSFKWCFGESPPNEVRIHHDRIPRFLREEHRYEFSVELGLNVCTIIFEFLINWLLGRHDHFEGGVIFNQYI